jgi:hypothetical protein
MAPGEDAPSKPLHLSHASSFDDPWQKATTTSFSTQSIATVYNINIQQQQALDGHFICLTHCPSTNHDTKPALRGRVSIPPVCA